MREVWGEGVSKNKKPFTLCGIPIVYNEKVSPDTVWLVRGDILAGKRGQELLKTGVVKLVNVPVTKA